MTPRAAAGAPPAPKPELPLAKRFPLRIVVADDNAINQKVAARILQQLGYQPALAANGREVLDLIERQPVDLVFMDVMMPELDGLEATQLLRKRQAEGGNGNFQSRIVVVAMTAHAMQGDREKCLASGMDDYLPKPVRPKEVRDMIERWGALTVAGPAEAQTQPVAVARLDKSEPPVDMSRVNEFTDGNTEMLCELMDIYFKQTLPQLSQLRAAIRENKADSVRRVAHSCAGASATLGMTGLVPRLRELEKLGASGTLTGAGEICENAAAELERIRHFLKAQPGLDGVIPDTISA
jgi:CheY-like chemotaxis protein